MKQNNRRDKEKTAKEIAKEIRKEKTGKKWKQMLLLCSAIGMCLVFVGCGGYKSYESLNTASADAWAENDQYASDAGMSYYDQSAEIAAVNEEAAANGETGEVNNNVNAQSGRKLIKTVNLSVETKEFDSLLVLLQNKVAALGGYIENMDSYNGSMYSGTRTSRNANLTMRIPKNELDGFLDSISDACNVVSRSESVEDVTLSYVDLESHKNALKTEQTRLLELLGQAETIEDILSIENRLSNVRYQLESMESQLRTYDNKIDYSTVYLYIDEVRELTPVSEETAWERISGGFVESLKNIGEGLKEFGIWFLIKLPYIVFWAAIITAIVFIILTLNKRSKKKNLQKQNAQKPSEIPVQNMGAPNTDAPTKNDKK